MEGRVSTARAIKQFRSSGWGSVRSARVSRTCVTQFGAASGPSFALVDGPVGALS